jgi:hypothetical protein
MISSASPDNPARNPEIAFGDCGLATPADVEVRFGAFAVGTAVAGRPPHRSERARFGHSAPTLGV